MPRASFGHRPNKGCKSCKKDAEKDPAATLAKVEKLKAKAKEEDKKK
jgi:hypothetical protein